MTFPPTFRDADHYMNDCIDFFEEFQYAFRYPNTEVLVKNVFDNIDVANLENINVFDKDFDITEMVTKDKYIKNFFNKLDRLHALVEEVEAREFDEDFDAPLSPKKRYQILNMVKELGSICEANSCELLVDFGSGLGYLDQLIFDITKFNVLGLECNQSHYEGAQKRQTKYHINSTSNVQYIRHTITEDSHLKIAEYIKEKFPDHKQFCIIGLHACADLTVEAMFTFLKMADAKSIAIMPCCYHKMTQVDGKFKYFPLSDCLKDVVEDTEAEEFLGIPFMRLAAHSYSPEKDLYEMVFDLLVRAVLQLYAHKYDLDIQRNKRKAVRLKDRNDFETYILEAAQNGYTLTPKNDTPLEFPKQDQVINNFNLDEIRSIWWAISKDLTFKKAGIFILLQMYLQPIVENFILLDRLIFFKEQGINDCCYKKIFAEEQSPRCLALIANK